METLLHNAELRTEFVKSLYSVILGRDADQEGLKSWISSLENGMSQSDLLRDFLRSPESRFVDGTALFARPGHYYSPIASIDEITPIMEELSRQPIPDYLPGLSISKERLFESWLELCPFFSNNGFSADPKPGARYHYNNRSFSWGDGAVLNAIIRTFRPERIIEIGNGWSSACILDTIERHLNYRCEVTFIDPYQELLDDVAGQKVDYVTHIQKPIQKVHLSLYDTLGENDILFIDSTHVLKPGSDVCFELSNILGRLKPGVLVHIHDMFWPFEYPFDWNVGQNRSWNELYAVRFYLTDNVHWEFIMMNNYMASVGDKLVRATWPDFLNNSGGSLWLRRL